ncbi:hypothetical protein KY343_07140 [Candidatus Woesearchaeota archaeon]|nr:hypothetical protein [Candidatus Woesearchaeota archaeon]
MKHRFRELEVECYLTHPKERPTLTMVDCGTSRVNWEFECRNAVIDEEVAPPEKDYVIREFNVMCKFTNQTCPVYLMLLRQAEEM